MGWSIVNLLTIVGVLLSGWYNTWLQLSPALVIVTNRTKKVKWAKNWRYSSQELFLGTPGWTILTIQWTLCALTVSMSSTSKAKMTKATTMTGGGTSIARREALKVNSQKWPTGNSVTETPSHFTSESLLLFYRVLWSINLCMDWLLFKGLGAATCNAYLWEWWNCCWITKRTQEWQWR